ncbi:MAG: hypothetical protein KF722_18630 [Nitrospira sp.]|nr:hypothetical protein [Nitrospira sp.]
MNTVFDNYCESGGTTKSQNFGLGLDAIVKAIPVKFTLNYGSNEEAVKNFCKNYQSVAAGRSDQTQYQEKIVQRAYQSFDQCIAIANTGVVVRHDVRTLEQVDFYVAPGFGHPITIKGISTSDGISCNGQDPNDSKNSPAKKFDLSTRLELKDNKVLNLVCVRAGQQDKNGNTVFKEGVVTLLTDINPAGNYAAFLPQDTRIAESTASAIQKTIDGLTEQNKALKDSQEKLKASLKTHPAAINSIQVVNGGGYGTVGPQSCPPGQYVSGIAVIDHDNGGYCISCIDGVIITCRPIGE